MKKRILALAAVSVLAVSVFAGCAGDRSGSASTSAPAQGAEGEAASDPDATYNWRMAHEEYEGDMQDVYCKEFAQLLNEKSDGRITLEVYQVGQIGDALQQCELLQNGGLEFAVISPGNTGTVVPENQLFSLHFLFPEDMTKTQQILRDSVALNEMLTAKYLEKKIQPLSYWTEGAMQWTANKPLNTPDAFKGLKFRTMQSPMIIAAYEAYGANPTPMSYLEVYSGLQLNMIEGQENPISAIHTSKFHEVQDYLTRANSNLYITATCVNPDFFNSLPADIQQIVLDCIDEMVPRSFEIQEELNGGALDLILEESDIQVVDLTEEERAAFKEKALTAYDKYKELVGQDGAAILDKLLEEVAAVNAE
ncbi:DctP family TRAP transporter solute-binding subunit [Anaerotignum faecicola]|nr:DctP family TRAP transporter solute-binding subunit [Anaerotignum faecicola]